MAQLSFREDFFDDAAAASYLGKSPRTLKAWRNKRVGPPVTYIMNTPYYRKTSLKAWLFSLEGKPARQVVRKAG